MIKAFLFDYDGVMTAGADNMIPARNLAANLGVASDQASEWIASIWDGYSTGKLSNEEAWQRIEAQYGKEITDEQKDIWFKWADLMPLPEMLELVQSLRQRGFVVGLLSNILPPTADTIRANGGYDGFDFLVLSHEAGVRKPNRRIYEIALAKLPGIQPSEVAFFDDTIGCIAVANELGLNAWHVLDHPETIACALTLADDSN